MSRAEESASKAYPIKKEWVGNQYGYWWDVNEDSRVKYQEGYEQALKDLADEAIETEDTLIIKGLIDAKSGELYNMKENKELLKDFCHKIGGSAVNVIIKKR